MLAALEHERTLDDLRITRHVVVSARQDREDELAIGEVDTRQRCGRERAGRLRDDAVALIQVEHLRADLPLRHAEARHAAGSDDRVRVRAEQTDRRAVDERIGHRHRHRASLSKRRLQRRRPHRFDADDARRRMALAHPRRDARQQPAATDGHDDDIRHLAVLRLALRERLECDGALPRDGADVVERGHERRPGRRSEFACSASGDVVRVALDDRLDPRPAEHSNPLTLLTGRRARQEDRRLHAEARARVCDALGMVAGRRADDARRARVVVELRDEVARSTNLVRAHRLLILALEHDARAELRRQAAALEQHRGVEQVGEALGGGFDVGRIDLGTQGGCARHVSHRLTGDPANVGMNRIADAPLVSRVRPGNLGRGSADDG